MCAHSHWAKDGSGIILNDRNNNRNGTKHRRQEALVINKAKKCTKVTLTLFLLIVLMVVELVVLKIRACRRFKKKCKHYLL